MVNYSDVIIALHDLARKQWDTDPDTSQRLRFLADEVAKLGNEAHRKEILLKKEENVLKIKKKPKILSKISLLTRKLA